MHCTAPPTHDGCHCHCQCRCPSQSQNVVSGSARALLGSAPPAEQHFRIQLCRHTKGNSLPCLLLQCVHSSIAPQKVKKVAVWRGIGISNRHQLDRCPVSAKLLAVALLCNS
ncbi:uncharacterized protein HMPREF1120_03960 [Exophiala dermatitidis NIH/UT8656]|uniref:Uncharacterized protein n=1 Tax=Exophiala dermatitidis (strain ATCC 34100 / CBS 525.76 / NIH/UT8656) TaxID=858893 RepID=H6BV60_EXODN|nr:uncharacterized protein HMPREF1120_03960 [Exophiala dermatitidis NIH/UT8656]EHY55843.1 hypothetical protein HMPREF1120_03960 [Exophiala dermatitidis NIH/UT8656]